MSQYWVTLAALFVASAATSWITTAIVKNAAEHIGAVDHPGERKIHFEATPRLGGLAIIFGFGFPLLLGAANSHAAGLVSKNLSYLFAVLASGSLIIGLGVYDDLIGSNAPKKFLIQTLAAIILVAFGFHFTFVTLGGEVIELGILGFIVSVIWIVGVINAINFIDGMDSLATVVAITIAVSFGIIAIIRLDVFSLVIMTALAGSLIGFYPWNKPPAKIFMGDSGSLFIGLLLAACSIARPAKSSIALIVGGPMLALALPVLDTLIVMQHRFGGVPSPIGKRLTRVFNADRNHIHHVLIHRYGSTWKAIVSIWSVTVVFAVAAVLTVVDALRMYGYTLAAVGLASLLLLRYATRARSAQPSV